MFCENCGYKLEEGLKYCPNCGVKIEYGSNSNYSGRDRMRPGSGADEGRDRVRPGSGADGGRDRVRPDSGAEGRRDRVQGQRDAGRGDGRDNVQPFNGRIGAPDEPLKNTKGPKDPSAPPIANIDLSGIVELFRNKIFRMGALAGASAVVTFAAILLVTNHLGKQPVKQSETVANEASDTHDEESVPADEEKASGSENNGAEQNAPENTDGEQTGAGDTDGEQTGPENTGAAQKEPAVGDVFQATSSEEFAKGLDFLYGEEYTVPVKASSGALSFGEQGVDLSSVPAKYLGYYCKDLDQDGDEDLLLFKLTCDHTVAALMCLFDSDTSELVVADSAAPKMTNDAIANTSLSNMNAFIYENDGSTYIGAQFLDESQGNVMLNVSAEGSLNGTSFDSEWKTDNRDSRTEISMDSVDDINRNAGAFILSQDEVTSIREHKKYVMDFIPGAREVFRIETTPSGNEAVLRFFDRESLREDGSELIAEGKYYYTTEADGKGNLRYEATKIDEDFIYGNEFHGIKGGSATLTSQLEIGASDDEEGKLLVHNIYDDNAVKMSFKYFLYNGTDFYVGAKDHYFLVIRRDYDNSREEDGLYYPSSTLGEDTVNNDFSFEETINVFDMEKAGTDEEDNVFNFSRSVDPSGKVECSYRMLDDQFKLTQNEENSSGSSGSGTYYFSDEKEMLDAAMEELATFFGEDQIRLLPISWDNKMEAMEFAYDDWIASYRVFLDEGAQQAKKPENQDASSNTADQGENVGDTGGVTSGNFRVKAVKMVR